MQQEVKQGDIVLYSAFGRTVNALVLAVRHGETSHLGANGEPILTLAFIDPPREIAVAPKKNVAALLAETRQPQVFVELDVVHESHEFDEDFLEKHGRSQADIASQRGHGEWTYIHGDIRLVNLYDAANRRADLAEKVAASLRAELDNIISGQDHPPAEAPSES